MAKMNVPKGGCTVRCYRHGLGDCFLLGFRDHDGAPKYMLIDCGVLTGTPDATNKMKAVARDISDACDGRLDAIVVTHEHWDHVSGFSQAKTVFQEIEAEELWLAWTEDPKNALAAKLRERKREALRGLRKLRQQKEFKAASYGRRIDRILEFYGDLTGARGRITTESTMTWLKKNWRQHRYCKPGGAPLKIAGLDGFNFFVLGPPEDRKFIRKSRPSKKGDQVYLSGVDIDGALLALGAAAGGVAGDGPNSGAPFNPAFQVIFDDRGNPTTPFRSTQVHAPEKSQAVHDAWDRYDTEKWRQIDKDWLHSAGELALRLDEHTNNTSLVLAIELADSGKVLLFPADAQVGNWLSWRNVRWPRHDRDLTARDLLSRVCFYKVGHHASHNATLNKDGLELMTSNELEAFIPVEKATAKRRKWKMPYGPLHKRLKELTNDKVYVSDELLTPSQKSRRLKQTDLYLDIQFTN